MTTDLFIRDIEDKTLADLREQMTDSITPLHAQSNAIAVDFENLSVEVPYQAGGSREFPLESGALSALSSWLQIPTPFLGRLDNDMREYVIGGLLARSTGDCVVYYDTDTGLISEIKGPDQHHIPGWRIVDVARRVIDPSAQVVLVNDTPSDFLLDVIVPENYSAGVGGDLIVGDITRGGLRFGHDRARSLTPWVQPYFYRLICTNGMEVRDTDLKIDGRAAESVDDVLMELDGLARRVLGRMDETIAHYYDLRSNPVPNPTERILAIGREADLPNRTRVRLAEAATQIGADATEFDIANLITNFANAPGTRLSAARTLQQIGGAMVEEHAVRCASCHSRIAH